MRKVAKNNTVPHNGANTRRSVLKKLEIEFGKGQYAFYPIKLSRFAEKNKVHQKYQNLTRRDPYKLSKTPLDQKISKLKHYFGGL